MTSIVWSLLSRAIMKAGELRWNLTSKTSHQAGATLAITFTIRNTTATEREYRVYIGLFDLTGPVITTWPLPDSFVVAGESERSFSVNVKVDYSNCIMQSSLYDIQTGEMGASLQTVLEQPPVPEPPPSGRLEDWFPTSPLIGPPLPKWLGLTWPWYSA
ncbi:hypothetical protein ES703_98399 [subsurface metagenome]